MFRAPAHALLKAQLTHNPNAFCYLFEWTTDFMGGVLGACHALELGFVFGTYGQGGGQFFGAAQPGAAALSDAMVTAWTNFAKTGNPGGDSPIPNFDADHTTYVFDESSGLVADPRAAEREIWQGMQDKIGAM